jgi:hypothetical protein
LLTEIKDFVLERNSHSSFHRMVVGSTDASKIQDYRVQIQQALNLFGVR